MKYWGEKYNCAIQISKLIAAVTLRLQKLGTYQVNK